MKRILTLSFLLFSIAAFAQQKAAKQPAAATPAPSSETQRTADQDARAGMAVKARTTQPAPLPYDVNDMYMGRKNEFLNQMIVSELPADFPIYRKGWSLTDYNQVVHDYYINHKELLTQNMLNKINSNEKK